jgi:hypothetical protein
MSTTRTAALVIVLALATLGLLAAGCGEVDSEGALVDTEASAAELEGSADPTAPVELDSAEPLALALGHRGDDPGDDDDCVEGEIALCYDGPADTAGIGACRPGVRQCDAHGHWGSCLDAVEPDEEESCNGIDDTCDGVVDEGCCEVDEACEPERPADFCSDTLVTITCEAGSDCVCPAGQWCLLQCPEGGCVFRWESQSCATLQCDSCDCAAVAPPAGIEAAASACWHRLAP